MAFRSLSLKNPTVLMVLVGGSGVLLYPRYTLLPEAPQFGNRKPIYNDTPSSTGSTLKPPTAAPTTSDSPKPTPTDRLSVYVSHARMHTYYGSLWLENHVNGLMSSALSAESTFTNTVASLAPKKETGEQLMPGLIYVLVSAMAGSIVSRNRGILLRGTTPLAAGVAAGWYFIPVTMRNLGDLMWEAERRVPAVAEGHMMTRGFLEEAGRQSYVHSQAAGKWVDRRVGDGLEMVEGWVRKGR